MDNTGDEVRQEFWKHAPVSPIPLLSYLRTAVLTHNATRCPKWRFRFGEDLAIQIQPRPTPVISEVARARGFTQKVELFEGIILQGQSITQEAFERHVKGVDRLKFDLFANEGEPLWVFRPTHLRMSDWIHRAIKLKTSAVEALPQLDHLELAMMFQPACLVCGKALTDPVSMARWIGPECAGRASLDSVLSWHVPTAQGEAA
jgi:hypothetical protein